MINRLFKFSICILVVQLFTAEASAQQIVQYSGPSGFQEQPQGAQNRQTAFTENAPVQQPDVPVYDPMQVMEMKIDSLQFQLDSLRNTGNGDACQSCDDCENKCVGGLYFGAAAVFAKPHFKEAFQYSQTNLATGLQSLIPFAYDYEVSPRIWVGYRFGNGFGAYASYWNYDQTGQTNTNVADGINVYGAHAVSIIFPANIFAAIPGETLINADSLQTEIQNYYLTYDTEAGRFLISGKFGLRYATFEQTFDSAVLDQAGTPIRQLNWRRQFEGLGPAAEVEVKRRLGCTRLSGVAHGGGGFMFGNKTLERTVFGDQSPQPATPFLALEDADEVVGIGEVGFGMEWSCPVTKRHHLAVRGTYDGQLWAEGGAPTLGFLGFEGFNLDVELRR